MNTMKGYHDLYLKVDLLLLVYVFESFRKECINSFELDPAYYLSTPGYSWNPLLWFTDVNLKLISDIEKYQFFESTIKGGISMIFKGYAEANNKFLKSCKSTLYITYLDADDLYGHLMMQHLAIEILDQVNPKNFSLHYYSNDNPIGCFLEVDLDYSDELHDLHNYYPLAGEKIGVRKEMWSIYQLQIKEEYNFSLDKNKKRIPNIGNKLNKTQTLLSKLETLFKFIAMQREPKKEGTKIKKQDAKLRDNCIFVKSSKSTENPMKKVDVKIVTTRKQFHNGARSNSY